jgi:hypothetical protein
MLIVDSNFGIEGSVFLLRDRNLSEITNNDDGVTELAVESSDHEHRFWSPALGIPEPE